MNNKIELFSHFLNYKKKKIKSVLVDLCNGENKCVNSFVKQLNDGQQFERSDRQTALNAIRTHFSNIQTNYLIFL